MTTRLDLARAIAARHADFCVYRVKLDEPIEADPGACPSPVLARHMAAAATDFAARPIAAIAPNRCGLEMIGSCST